MDTIFKSHSFVKLWIATTMFILCCFATDAMAQDAVAADTIASVTETITEVTPRPAEAATAAPDTIGELALGLNTVWMLIAAMLVFFMQPGFALVEAGFTRVKNTANILMKNFVNFMFGSLPYWFIGFGLMFGVCGFLGTILTSLFSTSEGLFYGYGAGFLGAQLFGALIAGCWAAGMGFIIFKALDKIHGLRVPARVEEEGLDIYEHGESAYN